MMISETLARLRKESGFTQPEVASYLSERMGKPCMAKSISNWETRAAMPSGEQLLLLCELYGVRDIQATFRGLGVEYRGFERLNKLGKSRVEEYIAMLSGSPLFSGIPDQYDARKTRRIIRLYDTPAAAGTGSFLDGDFYEDFEIDETVSKEAEFAVKISGDSMTPRFVDGQIVFIKEQQTLAIGEIGIFGLGGESYIKKLGHGELLSLNPKYEPIQIHEYSPLNIFGKVVG